MKNLFAVLALTSIIIYSSCKKGDHTPPPVNISFKIVADGTTPKSYIAVGSTGSINASRVKVEVTSSFDDELKELKFVSSGRGVKSVTIGGKVASFQNGIAIVSGLKLPVTKNVANTYMYDVSYYGIGSGVSSNDTNSVSLVSVKSHKSRGDVSVTGIISPAMKMVFSKPDSVLIKGPFESLILDSGGYLGKYRFAVVEVYINPKGSVELNSVAVRIFTANVKLRNLKVLTDNSVELPTTITSTPSGVTTITFNGGFGFGGLTRLNLVSGLEVLIQDDSQGKVQIATNLMYDLENPITWTDKNGGSNILQEGTEYYYGPVGTNLVFVTGQFVGY